MTSQNMKTEPDMGLKIGNYLDMITQKMKLSPTSDLENGARRRNHDSSK